MGLESSPGPRPAYQVVPKGIASDPQLHGWGFALSGQAAGLPREARRTAVGSQPFWRLRRVNVQLIYAKTDTQRWADRLDRPAGDLFALQNEITSQIRSRFMLN